LPSSRCWPRWSRRDEPPRSTRRGFSDPA